MNPAELQEAVFDNLNVIGLTGLLSSAYGVAAVFNERAPQPSDAEAGVWFPYVTFHFPASQPFDTKDGLGQSSIVQIDGWSRLETTQIKVIAAQLYGLMHRQPLGVAGHITTEIESMDFFLDPDGLTRRAMLRFRVLSLA